MGLLWSVVTPPVRYIVRADGVYSDGPSNTWFAADGWFLVLGALCGAVLAGVAWWRVRSHPVTATFGVTAAGLVLAAAAWWLGGIVGPQDPTALIDAAQVGTTFEAPLGLRAVGVLLSPAIVGLAGFLLLLGTAAPRPESAAF